MVKDYLQDIVPPHETGGEEQEIPIRINENPSTTRSIRNISVPERNRPIRVGDGMREAPLGAVPPRPPRRSSRLWIWAAAALSLLIVGALALIAFRPTTVTVIPKSRAVTFSDTILFVARPVASVSGASPTLSYTVQTSELEDSEVVPAQGTTHVETKASGSITVFNEYSSEPVTLVKNTRFETPEGLIFKTPAEIVVPGKKNGPGQVKVTVIAEKAGEKYNVGPISRFTLPGLKSGAMYKSVYAKSTTAMAGGFVGEQPGTAPGALNTAIAAVRARLEAKARETARALGDDKMIAFPDLISITFQSLPNTVEAGTGVRIHEKAIVEVPLIPLNFLTTVIAQALYEEGDVSIALLPAKDLAARYASTSAPTLGVDDLTFFLTGTASLVWKVDGSALANALKGRDSAAFQTIVQTFPGVQEARARIEPFWKKTFPADASDIKVVVTEPKQKP